MKQNIIRTNVICDCGCGEIVVMEDEGFNATTVRVYACSDRAAAGEASRDIRKSAGYALTQIGGAALVGFRHTDGLTVLS